MLGTPSNPGVIPRVINGLFQQIEEDKAMTDNEWVYKVTFSYLEIYQEKVWNKRQSQAKWKSMCGSGYAD